jgi:hypothetical protein
VKRQEKAATNRALNNMLIRDNYRNVLIPATVQTVKKTRARADSTRREIALYSNRAVGELLSRAKSHSIPSVMPNFFLAGKFLHIYPK